MKITRPRCGEGGATRAAAWGIAHEEFTHLVRGAKRSAVYRRQRRYVASPCPLDVWVEEEFGFVLFELAFPDDHRPGWLIFAVRRADDQLAAAKAICPDESGDNLLIRDLLSP